MARWWCRTSACEMERLVGRQSWFRHSRIDYPRLADRREWPEDRLPDAWSIEAAGRRVQSVGGDRWQDGGAGHQRARWRVDEDRLLTGLRRTGFMRNYRIFVMWLALWAVADTAFAVRIEVLRGEGANNTAP